MAHVADYLVILGVILAFPAGIAVGWWLRGRRRSTVI
jgi:hypothetical protein